jgi:hypothetical protein
MDALGSSAAGIEKADAPAAGRSPLAGRLTPDTIDRYQAD